MINKDIDNKQDSLSVNESAEYLVVNFNFFEYFSIFLNVFLIF